MDRQRDREGAPSFSLIAEDVAGKGGGYRHGFLAEIHVANPEGSGLSWPAPGEHQELYDRLVFLGEKA